MWQRQNLPTALSNFVELSGQAGMFGNARLQFGGCSETSGFEG